MFVWRWRYERLQAELEGARLFIARLEQLVEYERSRAHLPSIPHAAEIPDQAQPEEVPLPPKVSRAVAQASKPGTEIHTQLVEAAHASLQDGMDEERVAYMVSLGDRSFDSLLKIG
jgi:hypothetical protein